MPTDSGAATLAIRTTEPVGRASISAVSLPTWIFGRASALEIAVLCGIQSDWPDTCPTLQRIADRSGVSRRTVANVLDALESRGWIRRVQRTSEDGTNLSSHYDLLIWSAGEPLPSAGS